MTRHFFCRLLSTFLAAGTLLCVSASAAAQGGETPSTAGPVFTEQEQAYIDSCGPLRVGYVQDRIPISFANADGDLDGISRYVFDRIEQLSGLDFEYVPLPNGDITYDYLLGEDLDLVTSVEYNPENLHANGILTSEPYLSSRKVVVTRSDMAFDYDADLHVAVSTGSQTLHKVLGRLFPNFVLDNYASIDDCFDAVRSGATDLTIQNQFVVEYWLSKPAYDGLQVIPLTGLEDQLCFSAVVAFGGGDGPSQESGLMLIGILNKAIAAISEDEASTYIIQGVMENQYSFTEGDFLYRYRYAVISICTAVPVIVLLAVLLLRQRMRAMQDRSEVKAREKFLSDMSHELRTPLNGLVGLNYLMTQNLGDPERLADYLRQSSSIADYLLSLISDMLDMSSIQSRELVLASRPLDLTVLMDAVTAVARGDAEKKGLRFDASVSLSHPAVLGDEVRIQQVLLNLLDNACKFTPAGGHVSLRVEQALSPSGEVITRAEVADTGRGMSPEFQKHLFESFARELDTVSPGNQGAGLGLPICLNLAKLMGGELTFTSKKDVGSTFSFTFLAPQADMPAGPAAAPAAAPAAKARILVAEDNELNGEIMLDLLEDNGFRADLARNGREALDMFRASAPGEYAAVLMDLLMPEMDGFQAAAAIRALDRPDARAVKIIACTANSSPEDRARAQDSGMDGFLTKPIDLDALLRTLSGLK